MTRHVFCYPVVLVLTGLVLAGDGQIPIYQATTIDAPGVYYVTRDFGVSGQDGITIESHNVTLDLGGHTITLDNTNNGIAIEDGYGYVTIRNGRIRNARWGVIFNQSSGVTRVAIEDLDIIYPVYGGININSARYVEIKRCIIERPLTNMTFEGIVIDSEDAPFTGTISDNVVSGTGSSGIFLDGITNAKITGNHVSRFGQNGEGRGIYISGRTTLDRAYSLIVENNTVQGDQSPNTNGIAVSNSDSARISNNNVSNVGTNGISIFDSPNAMLAYNNVSSCGNDGFKFHSGAWTLLHNKSCQNGGDGVDSEISAPGSSLVDGLTAIDNSGYGLNCDDNTVYYRNCLIWLNDLGSVQGGTDSGGNLP